MWVKTRNCFQVEIHPSTHPSIFCTSLSLKGSGGASRKLKKKLCSGTQQHKTSLETITKPFLRLQRSPENQMNLLTTIIYQWRKHEQWWTLTNFFNSWVDSFRKLERNKNNIRIICSIINTNKESLEKWLYGRGPNPLLNWFMVLAFMVELTEPWVLLPTIKSGRTMSRHQFATTLKILLVIQQ